MSAFEPNLPDSPLAPEQAAQLQQLTQALNDEQLTWVAGYLQGLRAAKVGPVQPPAPGGDETSVTVLYGSQTGNARKVAIGLHEQLVQAGLPAEVADMRDYKAKRLKREQRLLTVISTHGEGEPPDTAQLFYELLFSRKAPNLENLEFAVLGLGDTSYEQFCKMGCDVDAQLEALGGTRLLDRVDCDVDFEDAADAWSERLVETLRSRVAASESGASATVATPASPSGPRASSEPRWTRRNPYPAEILDNSALTGRGSSKEVRHVELSLDGADMKFAPGDSMAVIARNDPALVNGIVDTLELDPQAEVAARDGGSQSLATALEHECELTTLARPVIERYGALAEAGSLTALLDEAQREALRAYLTGRDVLDLVREYPIRGVDAGAFVNTLRRLQPRLYSIASSHAANPDEVHLTVDVVRYDAFGRPHAGAASTFLTERIGDADTVSVYVEDNPNFRLPEDDAAPIIMIGPGTGVAPFRAFLETREETGAEGRNWLLFGDRNMRTDFLYQREWLAWRESGLLSQLDVAFSRDGAGKRYVQHRMAERSRELYAWLEEGAHLYVCGDAERMAPDVHQTLIDLVARERSVSQDNAQGYVRELQQTGRYQRDVY